MAFSKDAHFSILVEKIPSSLSLKPKSSACFLDKLKSLTRSLILPSVDKWGSNEEQLPSNVQSQSKLSLSCCLWSSSELELSSLKARFSRGFGAGNCSLHGTSLIADGRSGYFTVCLDLEVIRVLFVKRRNNPRSGGLEMYREWKKIEFQKEY